MTRIVRHTSTSFKSLFITRLLKTIIKPEQYARFYEGKTLYYCPHDRALITQPVQLRLMFFPISKPRYFKDFIFYPSNMSFYLSDGNSFYLLGARVWLFLPFQEDENTVTFTETVVTVGLTQPVQIIHFPKKILEITSTTKNIITFLSNYLTETVQYKSLEVKTLLKIDNKLPTKIFYLENHPFAKPFFEHYEQVENWVNKLKEQTKEVIRDGVA